MIIDILFTLGIFGFLWVTVRQLQKLYKTKETEGISFTKYYGKLAAIGCMIVGYILSGLIFSLTISLVELSLNFVTMYLIVKYRWGVFKWRKKC